MERRHGTLKFVILVPLGLEGSSKRGFPKIPTQIIKKSKCQSDVKYIEKTNWFVNLIKILSFIFPTEIILIINDKCTSLHNDYLLNAPVVDTIHIVISFSIFSIWDIAMYNTLLCHKRWVSPLNKQYLKIWAESGEWNIFLFHYVLQTLYSEYCKLKWTFAPECGIITDYFSLDQLTLIHISEWNLTLLASISTWRVKHSIFITDSTLKDVAWVSGWRPDVCIVTWFRAKIKCTRI